MIERKVKYEFKVVEWRDKIELQDSLNYHCNDGWQVEHHKIAADASSGWTMFKRVEFVNQPLLERKIKLGQVYNILNSILGNYHDPFELEKSQEFDRRLKIEAKQEGDED